MKPSHIIEMAPLDLRADVGAVKADDRTAELIFSTGADVVRFDWSTGKRYVERLSLKPEHIRLDRLNAGAPLLNAHSAYSLADQIGVVEPGSASVSGKRGTATVRFSKRQDAETIFQDVRDGIIRNVSVGYRVHRFDEQAGKNNEIPVRLATDWEPYEISLVPMGADSGARVRKSDDVPTNACVITRAEVSHMDETTKTTETPTAAAPPAPQPDAESIRAAATAAERARVTGIQDACRIAKLDASMAADMVSRGITLDAARAEVFTKLAERDAAGPETTQRVAVFGEDARDKFLRGVSNWLLVKGGSAAAVARHEKVDVSTIEPGEFRGMTLVDVARECLSRAGVSTRGMDKMRLVSEAFTRTISQSTSDFAVLLETTMHKILQASYASQPDTWSRWCGRSTVSDFRAHNRYRMGSFGALDSLNENGEFKHKAISDAEKATITAGTKGNIISISRQAIVNDDMGAFARLLTMLGRAAGLSVEVDAYALLALNSGLGPTQSDSQPLFHSNRSNVGSTAAISAASLDADRVVMASQKDPWGNEYLDLRPAVILVPLSLGGTARVINTAQYDPDTANKLQRPNIAAGLFRDIVDTPRISGTRRYLFADPAIAPVFEVAFLEGQESPVLETKDGWNTDGAEMKARFDYGVAAVDWRGAVTNAG